jgi:hypothetical protein
MSTFAWRQEIMELTPAALTRLAQTVDPFDDGMLKWGMFFPRMDVDSTTIKGLKTLDYRPVSDRREWNQRGRLIPSKTPDTREVKIVPIEGNYLWGEEEIQELNERFNGNAAMIAEQMQISVPGKVEQIAEANYRRIEIDAFQAWALGTITQRNPQNAAETITVSLAFDTARYQTASTAWNDAGLNAYDELMAWADDANSTVRGGIQGILTRRNIIREIQADAPDLSGGQRMTRVDLENRISDDLGFEFRFYAMEDTLEPFTDGGTATSAVDVWAAEKVAAVPRGTRVGYTAFAPVVRAMEIARNSGAPGIDTRGQTVYYEEHNNGRELSVEVQMNALPVPDEALVYVIDVGF